MIYIEYFIRAVLSLFIDVICRFVLNWIVAWFADSDGNLPRRLYWFQTFDATLDEGMFARQREIASGAGTTVWKTFNPAPVGKGQIYLNRAKWLWRNSAYGFDYYLLGIPWKPEEWRVVKFIDNESLTFFFAVSPGQGFNLYAFGRYGEVKIGWKAWNQLNKITGKLEGVWGTGGNIPVVFSPNPFSRKVP